MHTPKTLIITGAGAGLGRLLAVEAGRLGFSLCAADQNPDRAEAAAEQAQQAGGRAFGWQADVANRFQVSAMIEATRDRFGRIDGLLHYAHVNPRSAALRSDEWEVRRIVEVNLIGAFFCAQLVARVMAEEGGGYIGLLHHPLEGLPGGPYSAMFQASQAGLAALGAALAAELDAQVRIEALGLAPTATQQARLLLEKL